MHEFIAKSGAKVVISIAPWQDAKRLKAAILKEIAAAGIKVDLDADASQFVAAVLRIDSSQAVDDAIWPCLVRCTRADAKIVPGTFDTEEARHDYYQIVAECIMVNMRPLAEGLASALPPSLLAMVQKQIGSSDSPKP